jgi:hypothetical protein
MQQGLQIFVPVLALALWTLLVLLLIPFVRVGAARRREVTAEDFRYGESAAVPPEVSLPNRNYMNLLEAPVLFYVGCVVAFLAGAVTPAAVVLAWTYVGLRMVHSLIHLGYNKVLHRLAVFALSNVVLAVLLVKTLLAVTARMA